MKRKILSASIIAGCLICMTGIIGYGSDSSINNYVNIKDSESGDITNQEGDYVVSSVGNLNEVEERINTKDALLVGEEIIVTKEEVENAKDYYLANNESDANAEKDAIEYMTEFDAMYCTAVNAGYDVSEGEVRKYVMDLREMLKNVENADDVQQIISTYDSEDAYWEDMVRVYYKQLPIEKYVSDLEADFASRCEYTPGSEEYEKLWEVELSKIKQQAVKEQNFKKANIKNLEKFEE